mgnify:CR=1 FL=1
MSGKRLNQKLRAFLNGCKSAVKVFEKTFFLGDSVVTNNFFGGTR